MPTFAQNFAIGDVVYGLSQSRSPYVNSLNPTVRQYCAETGAFMTLDEYNNRSFLGMTSKEFGVAPMTPGTYDKPYEDTVRDPQTMTDINYNLDFYEHGRGIAALGEEQKQAARAWCDQLANSARSPEGSIATTEKQRKRNNDNITMKMIPRACKYGLEYMIMARGQTVHFVLDIPHSLGNQINMADVVAKRRLGGGGAPAPATDLAAMVPITFSELRCCYRNRDRWMPTGRLKFYLNLAEVPAPWISSPALWQTYEDARARKRYAKEHPILAKLGFGP